MLRLVLFGVLLSEPSYAVATGRQLGCDCTTANSLAVLSVGSALSALALYAAAASSDTQGREQSRALSGKGALDDVLTPSTVSYLCGAMEDGFTASLGEARQFCPCPGGSAGTVAGAGALAGLAAHTVLSSAFDVYMSSTYQMVKAGVEHYLSLTDTETSSGDGRAGGEFASTFWQDEPYVPVASQQPLLPVLSELWGLLQSSEGSECQRYRLCQLGQVARLAGPPYSVAVPLASLPLSWIKSQYMGSEMSELCWVMETMGRTSDCSQLYRPC